MLDDEGSIEVTDQAGALRYELRVDGEIVGSAAYVLDPDLITFTHTVVDPRWEGRGLGTRLVQAALDDRRGRPQRVVPQCWFVADFIRDHPEYLDLVDDAERSRLRA